MIQSQTFPFAIRRDARRGCNIYFLYTYFFIFYCRYELSGIKSELQNKYHAELEILREDYENRIDLMNVEHEDRLQSLERKYIDKIELLKFELDETLKNNSQLSICSAVQEVVSVFFC